MLFLITNDDGIIAPGINALRQELELHGRVVVVAPDRPKSATGLGITVHKPLRVDPFKFENSESLGYAVNGTPSDCVKIAVEALLEEKPDVLISGINNGPNLGTDVLYSGTVSAAIEGVINDIPSIAISLASWDWEDYGAPASFVANLAKILVASALPEETLLNVNVPGVPKDEIKGVEITRLGRRRYINAITRREDPRGKTYYWLGGEVSDIAADEGTDIWAVDRNYISISPIHLDVTSHSLINNLKKWQFKL